MALDGNASARPTAMVTAVAAASLLAVLAGCGASAVQVEPASPAGPDGSMHDVCRSLLDDLPTWLGEAARRPVEPDGAEAAAWGAPPIVLRCGVPPPQALAPSSPCTEIEDIGWFAEEAERGYYFTTIGRTVFVEVAVPDAYTPESDVLIDLAPAIEQSNPAHAPCS